MSPQSQYLQIKESKNLYLRPLKMKDLAVWKEFTDDAIALQYFPEEFRTNPNAAEDWILKQFERYQNKAFGLLALIEKSTGMFVGQCGLLKRLELEGQPIEIGYSLIRKHWGKGYASEAAQFLRDYAFNNQVADYLISLINPENLLSQKVAMRNGMQKTITIDFYDEPHCMFKITRGEWEALKAEC